MDQFDLIAALSPLPIVDLNNPEKPRDGLTIKLSSTCQQNYRRGDVCKNHYEAMAQNAGQGKPVQCPFGFATAAFKAGDLSIALTGFVPYPRIGGAKESIVVKRHGDVKVSTTGVQASGAQLLKTHTHFLSLEDSILKGQSMGLHEIRKLNRTIKQTAERLCKKDSPSDPDKAKKELVTIYKSSELMTLEFDVIEVLADGTQVTLPLNYISELYKMFDMCVRIYREVAGGRRLLLSAPWGYSPRVAACDKTFHIIPSVFIENALKYSMPGSDIRISLDPDDDGQHCIVTVINESEGQQILDKRVFQRGYRATTHKDGSGNGLYVAQLIANQHGSRIKVESCVVSAMRVRHTFRVRFKTTTEKWLRKG